MPHILIVDDDLQQLVLRQCILEADGHTVSVAASRPDALRRVSKTPPDLLLMDLRFPNCEGKPDAAEGLALIREAKQRCPGLPVIVLSGWPEDIYGQPEEQFVSTVLQKPFTTARLRSAIRTALPSSG
jgi:CheY-like chemotaxis protein